MQPTASEVDPEALLGDALSGVILRAHARGIALSMHVDCRLPNRVLLDAEAIGGFLRRGLARMADSGRIRGIGIALWLDGAEADGTLQALIEVTRASRAYRTPVSSLADLWTLPMGAAMAQPVAGRSRGDIESVLVPTSLRAVPDAPPVASRWSESLRGRRLLSLRDLPFDHDRLRQSMAAMDFHFELVRTAEAATEALRRAVVAGCPFDFLVLDGHFVGDQAIETARALRAQGDFAGLRIILTNARDELAAEDADLFDATPWAEAPWRRLIEVMHDLARELPRSPSAASAGAERAAAIPDLGGRRILVAEDVATNQVLLRAILAPTGASVEVVANGAEAIRHHGEKPADLIVMDLQMPGMGGIAALRAIRAMEAPARDVRVIALTAHARNADRKMALEAGMDAYLAKPIVVARFYDLLRELLRG